MIFLEIELEYYDKDWLTFEYYNKKWDSDERSCNLCGKDFLNDDILILARPKNMRFDDLILCQECGDNIVERS